MRANYRDYFTGGMGAESVRDLLDAMDLEATSEELREVIATGKGQKRAKAVKRLKVVDAFLKSDNKPSDMILDVIPVIPPDLRPMVQLEMCIRDRPEASFCHLGLERTAHRPSIRSPGRLFVAWF